MSRAARIRAAIRPSPGATADPVAASRPAERDDLLLPCHDPCAGRLEAGGQPAAEHQPDEQPDGRRPSRRRRPRCGRPERDRGQRRGRARCRARPASGSTTIGSANDEDPASQQEGGEGQRPGDRRRQRHEQRAGERRSPVHGAGLADAPGLGGKTRGELLQSLEGSLDAARSPRRSGRSRRRVARSAASAKWRFA